MQRNPEQRFMGGAWVFPGGAVHDEDGSPRGGRAARARGGGFARLPDTSGFVAFSRWITPEEAKIRFDTFFYVTRAPAGRRPQCDGSECVDLRWLRPADALDAAPAGS